MYPEIIFEDKSLLVLNKPAGWIVNEAASTKDQPVVQAWIKENFTFSISHDSLFRSGIVHRIDKETSGILLVAKEKSSFELLQQQFKERTIKKKYLALVHKRVEPERGEIVAPVGRLPWRRDRFGILPGGRDAQTVYETVGHYSLQKSSEDFTLLKLAPHTGRTHQIRIHLKYLGYPIVSDTFYTGRKTAKRDRKWCPRLFLHAHEIQLIHPESKNEIVFVSNLPADLENALSVLEKHTE